MKKLLIFISLFATLVACQNSQNNDSKLKADILTAVPKITEQDYAWIIDKASYKRANDQAYVECKEANQKAYTQNANANQEAYSECRNSNLKAYTEFNRNLSIIENELLRTDSSAYSSYLKKVAEEKKNGKTIASSQIQELTSVFPKSAAIKKFYNEFIKFENERDSVYRKSANIRDKKYRENTNIRDAEYHKNANIRDKKYRVIAKRYSAIGK